MSEAQKWYVNLYGSNQGKVYVGPLGHVVGVAEVNTICGMDQALKDAQLIVDAVNDLQTLRDERDRLRRALRIAIFLEGPENVQSEYELWCELVDNGLKEKFNEWYGERVLAALTPAGGGQERANDSHIG